MNNFAAIALKTTLAIGLIVSLLAQLLIIPAYIAEIANQFPEISSSGILYTGVGILITVCGQVVLIAIWALHTRVLRNRIFDKHATPWVNSITIAISAATALAIAGTVHLIVTYEAGNPATIGVLFLSGGAGIGLVLLISVLKSLLLQATEISNDLEEVI
jgi:hypothetical protein